MFHLDLGEGLELRLLRESDSEEVFCATERNREQLRPWLAWVDMTHTVEEPRQYILSELAKHEKREGLTAILLADGGFAGVASLHNFDMLNRHTSIGYWLDAQHSGRGLMTRACGAMVSQAFGEYGLHRVEIRCATGNAKSCAIPQRLGFVREGVLREAQFVGGHHLDLVVWSMLAHEWSPR